MAEQLRIPITLRERELYHRTERRGSPRQPNVGKVNWLKRTVLRRTGAVRASKSVEKQFAAKVKEVPGTILNACLTDPDYQNKHWDLISGVELVLREMDMEQAMIASLRQAWSGVLVSCTGQSPKAVLLKCCKAAGHFDGICEVFSRIALKCPVDFRRVCTSFAKTEQNVAMVFAAVLDCRFGRDQVEGWAGLDGAEPLGTTSGPTESIYGRSTCDSDTEEEGEEPVTTGLQFGSMPPVSDPCWDTVGTPDFEQVVAQTGDVEEVPQDRESEGDYNPSESELPDDDDCSGEKAEELMEAYHGGREEATLLYDVLLSALVGARSEAQGLAPRGVSAQEDRRNWVTLAMNPALTGLRRIIAYVALSDSEMSEHSDAIFAEQILRLTPHTSSVKDVKRRESWWCALRNARMIQVGRPSDFHILANYMMVKTAMQPLTSKGKSALVNEVTQFFGPMYTCAADVALAAAVLVDALPSKQSEN